MKLLLDENLSGRIVARITDLYPGSTHVKTVNLMNTDDGVIWTFAAEKGYALVSKDADFHHRSVVLGHPPKFIFLRVGNCPTSLITRLLRERYDVISEFILDPVRGLLVLSA
ncbi:MAG: DUF5615 family PIN-like protein [Blastocatellia bacterium]